MRYYQPYFPPPWPVGAGEVISANITNWTTAVIGNSVGVTVTACSTPNDPYPCGNANNPNVNMSTSIQMPAVSAN